MGETGTNLTMAEIVLFFVTRERGCGQIPRGKPCPISQKLRKEKVVQVIRRGNQCSCPPGKGKALPQAEGLPGGSVWMWRRPASTLLFRPLPLQVKEPPPHLQRIHHTIGQHCHLPSHRLDALLKLGNVSCGEHIPQRYVACKSKERGDPKACKEALPPLLTGLTGTHTSGPYLFHELHPCPQRGLKS